MSSDEKRAAVLRAIGQVAPFSACASAILAKSGEEHDLSDIVHIVKHDPAMTSRVLRVVNSAAYARQNPIHSIERAVSMLGESMIVGIAISEASSQIFSRALDGYAAEAGALWKHDLRCAIAARKLAGYTNGRVGGELAFTCGLLHDLGKAVISDFLQGTPPVIQTALDQHRVHDYTAAERALVGMDHAEAGEELARYWRLPEPLPTVLRHHHHPSEAPPEWRALTYTVHLGDIVAMMAGCGTGADTLQYALDNGYVEFIALEKDSLDLVMLGVEEDFARIAASLEEGGGESP
ncbi:MAG: HDOD domain-containing protein [Thermodesulfobacteriota bacterium]